MMQYFKLAFTNLMHRKVRSYLTMIGIFIGIAAVVALISLSEGLKMAVAQQFSSVGSDKILIRAAGTSYGPPGTGAVGNLTKHDLDLISKVNGVEIATGRLIRYVIIEYRKEVKYSFAATVPDTDEKARNLVIEANQLITDRGRMLLPSDRNKIVVGDDYATRNTFKENMRVGDKVLLNNVDFEVVGILKRSGSPQTDMLLVMNEKTLRDLLDVPETYDIIAAKVAAGKKPSDVVDAISRAMRSDRNEKIGDEDFTVQSAEELYKSYASILDVIQIFLVGIAGISLIVGGIGIMNTMYTAVLERTKEIGIMKAVGAKTSDILTIFLLESGMLGLVGGAIGIAIGFGLSKSVELIAVQALGTSLLKADTSLFLVAGALTFSFLIGSLSGLFPALQASKLQPVDALRYE